MIVHQMQLRPEMDICRDNLSAIVISSSVRRGAPMSAPPSGLLRYMLKACVAQILPEKSYLNVEKFIRAIGTRRGATVPCPLPP